MSRVDERLDHDPAYPSSTPPDASYPGQTRDVLCTPLDEIATPALWSRLARPLERSLVEVWEALALPARARPHLWVAIHYGRIAFNAHAWERARARIAGVAPDPNLVEPAQGFVPGLAERLEALRARLYTRRLDRRLDLAAERRERALARLSSLDPGDLDAGELARGPLDERTWTEILLPCTGERLGMEGELEPDACLREAVGLEQRCTEELGLRLTARRTLAAPELAAFLTVEERIRAVLDGSSEWTELASVRLERVEHWAKLDVPRVFWGRPRLDTERA